MPPATGPLPAPPPLPEPVPLPDPDPLPGRTQRSGEWEQWLDPAPRTTPAPAQAAAPQLRLRTRSEETDTAAYDGPEERVPSIVDRTGGNPGVALRHPRRTPEEAGGGNRVLGALIAVGIVVALVAVVLIAVNGSGKQKRTVVATTPAPASSRTAAARTTSAPGEPAVIATPGCEQRRTPEIVSGTDPGGTTDGPSAILAFERAYYVQRSGYAARAVVADNSSVPAAEQIQRGINQIPLGTLYCVEITRAEGEDSPARWKVRLTQQVPGQQPATFTQLITTSTSANRTLITAIAPG